MKAKDINIGGVIFHIEENGYFSLQTFLSRKPAQIEERLTEIFLSMLDASKLILSEEDIYEAIASLETNGSPGSQSEQDQSGFNSYILEIIYQQLGGARTYIY